ncbi:MAG: M48 family metallopeptidase, partial [Candidatus Omnitrophica bacterium]|nr:M48 family metallopeptidase [Candidatus Omnitrophota bacterium]
VPHYISFRTAEEALLSNISWIRRYLDKMKRRIEAHDALLEDQRLITREEAVSRLSVRLKSLAAKIGSKYNKISFRDQRTLWGSCSPSGNISLNVKLARLPDELIDYVILHELVHIRTRDHGKGFWAELDHLLGDARKLDRRLKKYCPTLL